MELRTTPVLIFGCIKNVAWSLANSRWRSRRERNPVGGSSCALGTDVLVPKCRLGDSECVRVLEQFNHRGPPPLVARELRVDDF